MSIHVLPLSISVNGQTYLDRVGSTNQMNGIEEMIKSEELPKNITTSNGYICRNV